MSGVTQGDPESGPYFCVAIQEYITKVDSRVRPIQIFIPIPIPGIGIGMKKIIMNPVSVSVRYGKYLGYWYRYRLGHIGIGNLVSYRFFNVISVLISV